MLSNMPQHGGNIVIESLEEYDDELLDGYYWLHEYWLDYSEWLTGARSAEAGGIATALIFILFGSLVLALVMGYLKPRTRLEKILFAREFFLVFLLAQFVVGLFFEYSSFWLRIVAYGGAGIASLIIAFMLVKEYTFDVWAYEERQRALKEQEIERRG